MACALLLGSGCDQHDDSGAPASSASSAPEVLLVGHFRRVAKPVSGTAQIVRKGKKYQLRLENTSVDYDGKVRVYLVGLPDVPTTMALLKTDTQYDFGPLEQGAKRQLIDLPSEPAPELRSVVLYEPRYRVNLAVAPLKPPE